MRSVQPGAEKINFRIQYSHTHQGTRMSLHHTLSRGIPQLCACRILDKRRRGTCYVKGYRSDVIKTVRKIFGVSRGAVRWCSRLRPVLSSEIHELWRAQIEVSPYAWFFWCAPTLARGLGLLTCTLSISKTHISQIGSSSRSAGSRNSSRLRKAS